MAAAWVLRARGCRHRRLLSSSAGRGLTAERGERQESPVNAAGGGCRGARPPRGRPRGLPPLRSLEGGAGEAAPAVPLGVAGRVRPGKSLSFPPLCRC